MSDPVPRRLRDRLPVNPPYEGLLADAYDAWIGVDDVFPDDAAYERLLVGIDGTVLELGCGTGRPMLRWLAAGHDVEGIDASADMLRILRRHAAERGLAPVLHHGDLAALDLGRRYAALVCPADTFTLIDDVERAHAALAGFAAHLQPGGVLALSLSGPEVAGGEPMSWHLRRTGTLADGTTVVVHEALHPAAGERLVVVYDRIETYDEGGRLLGTWLRRHHLRWWTQEGMAEVLDGLGFVDVHAVGDEDAWVTVATRP